MVLVRQARQWGREGSERLAHDADRVVLCLDASDGARWQIAHVLQSGYAAKTLCFVNPSIDVPTRARLVAEDFGVSAADLATVTSTASWRSARSRPSSCC
jgi:hypothetical protein